MPNKHLKIKSICYYCKMTIIEKYLKKTLEKYKSKNKFKFEETYLKQFLDILKKSKKAK